MIGGGESLVFLCSSSSAWSFSIRFAYEVVQWGRTAFLAPLLLAYWRIRRVTAGRSLQIVPYSHRIAVVTTIWKTTTAARHNMQVLCSVLLLVSACGESVVLRCDAASVSEPETAQVAQAAQAVQALLMWCHDTLPAEATAHAIPTAAIIPLPTSLPAFTINIFTIVCISSTPVSANYSCDRMSTNWR